MKNGGERGPVTFPAFKAGDPVLRGPDGGFDSHTLPPTYSAQTVWGFDFVPIGTLVLIAALSIAAR